MVHFGFKLLITKFFLGSSQSIHCYGCVLFTCTSAYPFLIIVLITDCSALLFYVTCNHTLYKTSASAENECMGDRKGGRSKGDRDMIIVMKKNILIKW